MSFFDDVGKKIAQTGQGVASKTQNLAESVKLNGMIGDEEKSINNAFLQIGKAYYETYQDSPDELFAQAIAGINESRAKIASYTEQLKKLKGFVNCDKCGAEVPQSSIFCGACGAATSTVAPTSTVTAASLCPKCNAVAAAGARFCHGCGYDYHIQNIDIAEQTPQPLFCEGCGRKLEADEVFCVECGHKSEG